MKIKAFVCFILFALMCVSNCGGSSGLGDSQATQYTLDVEGTISIAPTAAAIAVEKINQQQQIMIGTTLLEVKSDGLEELGVELINFDLNPQSGDTVDFNFSLNPSVTSSGIIFKACELGIPFGTSYIEFYLTATTINTEVTLQAAGNQTLIDDGQTLVLGALRAQAEADDRSRLPVLSDLPVINFLYQGQQHQATVDSLIIILTPQILDDTEG